MFKIRQLCVVLCLLIIITFTDAIMCYFCATSNEGDGCLTNWKALRTARVNAETESKLSEDVKNCSSQQKYCSIERIEGQGKLVAYLRDCSDGSTFSSVSTNLRKFQNLAPDNQTACDFSSTLICVTLCSGDFCNGPSAAAGFIPNLILLVFLFSACRIASS